MKPKILVIGGSYFAGRVFTMVASNQCELTLINRGRYSMSRYPDVQEIRCDRHDAAALRVYTKAGFIDTGYVDDEAPDCLNLMYRFGR